MNTTNKLNRPLKSWMNRSNLVDSLGISGTAFDNWGVEPVARIGREAFFTVADVLKNRLDRQAEQFGRIDDRGASDEQVEEKTKLIRQQRIAQEMKNEQARRELAPVSLISWTLSKVGSQIAAILESIPLKVKTVAARLSAIEIEQIRREIVKAQNAAASVDVDLDEYYGTNPGANSNALVAHASEDTEHA